jgi:hypothetical protein
MARRKVDDNRNWGSKKLTIFEKLPLIYRQTIKFFYV